MASPQFYPSDASWEQFAYDSLQCNDLDAAYSSIAYAPITAEQRGRLVLGLLLFYDLGTACLIADLSPDFPMSEWDIIPELEPTLVRGKNRRHFRGELAATALRSWSTLYPDPDSFAAALCSLPAKQTAIAAFAEKLPQVGPYFAWKLGDWYECLTHLPVDFRGAEGKLHSQPLKELKRMFPALCPADALRRMVYDFPGIETVHHVGRTFDIQDAETVCCGLKNLRAGKVILGESAAEELISLDRVVDRSEVACLVRTHLVEHHCLSQADLYAVAAAKGFK